MKCPHCKKPMKWLFSQYENRDGKHIKTVWRCKKCGHKEVRNEP